MPIIVDILARLNQPSTERAAYQLADQFDEAGRLAGDRFGTQFERGLAGRSARIQAAFNRIADNTSRVAAIQREYNEAVNGGGVNSARAVSIGEKLASTRRQEADATGRASVLQRQHNDAVREYGRDSTQALALSERLVAVRRLEGELAGKVGALHREYNEAVNGGGVNSARALALSERLSSARRKEADSHRAAAAAIRTTADGLNSVKSASEVAVESLASVGRKAGQAIRGVGVLGSLPVAQLLLDTAQAATTASQSVLLLPAAAVTAAAGIGTLKLATSGFSDAIDDIRKPEEFAADLALLGPSAQQAALSLQSLIPWFDQLRASASEPFFSGLGKEFIHLSQVFGPGLNKMVETVGQSFNQAFHGIFDIFESDLGQEQIANIMDNIGQTFKNLVPGAESFVNALLTLADVGSGFMPQLADSISAVAQDFSNFISTAASNGDLQRWMQEGIDAAKLLGDALWIIGESLFDLFGADAQGNISAFKSDVQALAEFMNILNGEFGSFNDQAKGMDLTFGADIREELDMLEGPSAKIRDFFMNLRHYSDIAVNAIIDFANIAKDALLNGPIKMLNKLIDLMAKPLKALGMDLGDTSSVIPNVPNIPHIDVTPFRPWQTQQQWQDQNVPEMNGLPDPKRGRGPFVQDRDKLFDVPDSPINPKTGKPFTDKESRDAKIAGLDPSLWKVDPYAPVEGLPGGGELGKTYAGIPGGAALPGMGKGGYGVVDQQEVLEADHRVKSVAHDLEESHKARLALEQDNNATQHDIDEAKWKELEGGWALQKAQADLVEKQRGTTKSLKGGMQELGAALDPDFGLGEGLAGFAKNLTTFVANLAMAPEMGRLNAIVQSDPIKGGYGLMGILGAQNIAEGKSPLLGRPFSEGGLGGPDGQGGLGGLASSITGTQVPKAGVGTAAQITNSPGSAQTAVRAAGGLNLSTIPTAAQKYANDCIDASARIILSHSGINKTEEELMGIITPGGSIDSQAAGLNKINPQGQYKAMQGSGGSQEAMFAAIKESIDKGVGSILNVAPGSSLAGHTFAPGHFIAATGYNPDGTINVSDTAKGTNYTVSQQDAFQGTRGRGIVAGTGTGPSPVGAPGAGTSPPAAAAAGGGPGAPQWSADWNTMLQREASGNWQTNTGNGFYGGLQFTQSSWEAAGGNKYAARADLATPYQQAMTAEKLLKMQGPGAWPNTFAPGSSGPTAPSGAPPASINQPPPPPVLPAARAGRGTGIKRGPQFTLEGGNDLADLLGGPGAAPTPMGPQAPGPTFPIPQTPDPIYGMPGAPAGSTIAAGQVGPFPVPPSVAAAQRPLPPAVGTLPGPLPNAGPAPGSMPGAGPMPAGPPGGGSSMDQTRIGGVTPGVAMGGSGGVGLTPGGSVDTAISMAASAADLFAPGAGQAAQVGIKLGARAAQYAGQVAAIGVNGLMETFLPTGGSELANSGWIPRIAGGLAGAKAALPNVAGGQTGGNDPNGGGMPGEGAPPLTPQQAAMAGGGNDKPGVQITNNIESNNIGATEDRQGADIARHVSAGYQGPKV